MFFFFFLSFYKLFNIFVFLLCLNAWLVTFGKSDSSKSITIQNLLKIVWMSLPSIIFLGNFSQYYTTQKWIQEWTFINKSQKHKWKFNFLQQCHVHFSERLILSKIIKLLLQPELDLSGNSSVSGASSPDFTRRSRGAELLSSNKNTLSIREN